MNVFGVGMTPDIRTWDNAQRRVGSMLAIGTAAFFVLIGLITYAFARESAAPFYWVLVVLLVLVLAYEVAILVLGLRDERAQAAGLMATPAYSASSEAAEDTAAEPAEASSWARPAPVPAEPEVDTITLRCGDCSTVFDITDNGDRPLYHNCPGCGAEGVLRDLPKPAAAPVAEPAPVKSPAPVYTPRPAEPATPTPVDSGVKRLKLRCGGCKDVFSLDDTGERPMESRCPHCNRKGIIR